MTGVTRGGPWVRGVVAVVLIAHGLIHAMGPPRSGVADLPQLTGTPSVELGDMHTSPGATGRPAALAGNTAATVRVAARAT